MTFWPAACVRPNFPVRAQKAEPGHLTGHRHRPICTMSRAAAGKADDSEQNVPDDVPPLVPMREPLEEESNPSASAPHGGGAMASAPHGGGAMTY